MTGFLALTPAQFGRLPLPGPAAWMSCHFSNRGLEDLPGRLPGGSLLILDDSILPENPNSERIRSELESVIRRFSCSGLLLDFQRPVSQPLSELAEILCRSLPCPVAVSEAYAEFTSGPVFLSLVPPHETLRDHTAPYSGRELWLELGPSPETVTVTQEGSVITPATLPLPPCTHRDEKLCCRYGLHLGPDRAVFTLYRDPEALRQLLSQSEDLGITRYAGLYQELISLYR